MGDTLKERANAYTSGNASATFRGLSSPAPPRPNGEAQAEAAAHPSMPQVAQWERVGRRPRPGSSDPGAGGGALEGRTPEPGHCGNVLRPCDHSRVYKGMSLHSDTAQGHPGVVGGKTLRDFQTLCLEVFFQVFHVRPGNGLGLDPLLYSDPT